MIKEECETALSKLWDNTFGTDCLTGEDLDKYVDIIDVLIQYVFDPQPYKFKELKKGMWVWDNRYKEVGLITLVCRYPHIRYCDGSISDSKFEEGCFFPVTKALEYQK